MPQKSKGMDKKLTTMKHEIAQEVSSAQGVFEQNGGRTPLTKGPLAKEPLAKPPKVALWPKVTLWSEPPP